MKKIILLLSIIATICSLSAQTSQPNSTPSKPGSGSIGGIDESGKPFSFGGSKETKYYDLELLPGMEFTGSWYYWVYGGTSLSANLSENPDVDWLTISPAQFTDYNDGVATKVDFIFSAPSDPGTYTTSINDLNGNWTDIIIINLTVTDTPTPSLIWSNIVPTYENFDIERLTIAPPYFYWETGNTYYYFDSCILIEQYEQEDKDWFSINPETICLNTNDSVNTHYNSYFTYPSYDSIMLVRTRKYYSLPSYYKFVYDAQIMSVSRPVDLTVGWNLIGYSLSSPMTPEQAFAPLISAGVLQMVSGYEQGGLFFNPNGPPFLNTLTEIKTGYGYWVKISTDYPGFLFP